MLIKGRPISRWAAGPQPGENLAMPKTQAKTLLTFIALLLTISSIFAQRLLSCCRYPGFCYAYGSPDSNCCAGLCVVLHHDLLQPVRASVPGG
ncbi:hypothetical protein HPP92_021180 [Vanilla planifolia]|uniref:Uncharacterized protein n=2 Tax=Vanilla planifolia TaxID=51239 RepID=A0A835UGV6_VANPL|nr:hypothetical protein HPP92_021180 [Vanilla planifolia]